MQKLWLHISLLVLSSAFSASLWSQKTAIPTHHKGTKDAFADKAINDTLLNNIFETTTPTLYASPNGGFLSGNSGYGESQKAQFYDASSTKPYTVYGFIYWFGYKNQRSLDSDSSYVELLFSQLDSSTTINNVKYSIPKTVFEVKKLLVKDIDTSATYTTGANVWMLSDTKAATFPFSASMNFKGLNQADTIALFNSSDGDVAAANKSWERWGKYWNTIQANWGVKVDFAIFPLVEIPDSMIAIHEANEPVQMQVFPNPASEFLTVNLNSSYEGEIDLLLIDMNGKVVLQETKGNFAGTSQSIQIPTSHISKGTYILSIGINKKYRSTKKIVIAH